MDFGSLLREHRLRVGWTQEQLAERSGVSAHAISVLEAGRRTPRLASASRFASALGLDASAREQMLASASGSSAGPAAAATGAPVSGSGGIPPAEPVRSPQRHQLPCDTRLFTGRSEELGQLLALAGAVPGHSDAGLVVISAIDGMAGVGKSALAIHAAHRLSEAFPDGQLFIDLHGHTTGMAPRTVSDSLAWLLHALGVPPQRLPEDLGARAAIYRDRLAGTRTLIVLDNAASTAQVRLLLPGTPGSLVMVTSRRRLTGLDEAHNLTLGTLPQAESITLLHRAAGPGRIPADYPAAAELVSLCGQMPLAVRITAARLRHHQGLSVDDVVEQLRDEQGRLERLQDDDRDLTVIFESSYAHLPCAEQHLFRSLALVPGPDFDAYAAAGLLGADHRTAEHLLESLLEHNLLIQRSPGRYRFHDLVRLYARTLNCGDPEQQAEREVARERLLDYYQHAARAADGRLGRRPRPAPGPAAPPTASPGAGRPQHQGGPQDEDVAQSQNGLQYQRGLRAEAPPFADRSAALAWMRTERDNLLACTDPKGFPTGPARLIALASALAAFLQQDGPWPQAVELHRSAVAAARECGDRRGEAAALSDLGRVAYLAGDFADAVLLQEASLTIHQQLGDRRGEADALCDLGRARHATGEFTVGVDLLRQALTIYQDSADRHGEALARHDLGRMRLMAGDIPDAVRLQEQALEVFQQLGDRLGEANALCDLGRARHSTGDSAAAVGLLRQVREIFRELANRQGEANTLCDLGHVHHEIGDHLEAAELQGQALAIFRDLGNRHGEANVMHELGRIRLAAGEQDDAAVLLRGALAIFQDLGNRHGQANAQLDLGLVRQTTGDSEEAAELLDRALATFRDLGSRQAEAEALNCVGDLVAETTGPREALVLYQQAAAIAGEICSPVQHARALEGIARCAERLGDRATAIADLSRAVALYHSVGAPQAASAAARLASLEATTAIPVPDFRGVDEQVSPAAS